LEEDKDHVSGWLAVRVPRIDEVQILRFYMLDMNWDLSKANEKWGKNQRVQKVFDTGSMLSALSTDIRIERRKLLVSGTDKAILLQTLSGLTGTQNSERQKLFTRQDSQAR
jgi:hypothetical protein